MRPTASIVVPAWNGADLTAACLPLVLATTAPGDEVVVVDNGSTDATAAVLAGFPQVRVVRHARNLGFGAGCNSGAAVARGDVVVFLNNDTLPVEGWLDDLLAPFDDPRTGATGPMSNEVSGRQHVDDPTYAPRSLDDVRAQARKVAASTEDGPVAVRRLVGFCLAVRRSAFEDVGGFDTRFGIGGYEDDDLCQRLTARGFDLLLVPRAFVHHVGHGTFDANGLDWLRLELDNRAALAAKVAAARPLSVLIRCDAPDQDALVSIVSCIDACAPHPEWRTEVVLLTRDPEALLPIARQIAGDVAVVPVLDGDDDDAAWRRGLAEATGFHRALLTAGERVATRELARLVARGAEESRPTHVARGDRAAVPGAPAPASTPG